MNDERIQTAAIAAIGEADTRQLAEIIEATLSAHGHYGREVSETLLERLKGEPSDPYVTEGLAQLNAVEGVLDGRLEAL